jgi:hypothetical protein
MTDEIDRGCEREQLDRDHALEAVRTAAANIPDGNAGDCDTCGEWSGRLVQGCCAPCRDKYGLP